MAPQKGKQGTKGQKQIVEENTATLNFYRNMILGSNGAFLIVNGFIKSEFAHFDLGMFLLVAFVHICCYQLMAYMAKAKFSPSGQLLDGGIDLNMEAGVSEHVKDLVILTSACQVLGILSRYFWLLWLLAPLRLFYTVWANFLAPWMFSSAAESPDVDEKNEKKQKKMERKMKYR